MKRQAGNALSEYAIIAMITSIVLAGGMLLVSRDLNGFLQALRNDMQGNAKAALLAREKPTAPTPSPQPAAASGQAPSAASAAPGIDLSHLSAEAKADYENYLKTGRMGPLVQTIGANGTTELMLTMMEQFAKEKLDTGEIDQTQYNALMELANKGHRIAAVEKLVEDGVKQCAGAANQSACYYDLTVTFDGQQIALRTLDDYIHNSHGQSNSADALKTPLNQKGVTGRDVLLGGNGEHGYMYLNDFYNQYQAVKNSGMLADPVIAKYVDDLTVEIGLLSSQTAEAAWAFGGQGWAEGGGPVTPPTVTNAPPDFIARHVASSVTDYNSREFCYIGDGQDTGTLCKNQ